MTAINTIKDMNGEEEDLLPVAEPENEEGEDFIPEEAGMTFADLRM